MGLVMAAQVAVAILVFVLRGKVLDSTELKLLLIGSFRVGSVCLFHTVPSTVHVLYSTCGPLQ